MMRTLKKENTQKPYKQIILDRLNQQPNSHKKTSNINTLKTQCTPDDKTQQLYEKIFDQFDEAVKVKYQPVPYLKGKKSVKRSMYMELLELIKHPKSKSKKIQQKLSNPKCCTEGSEKVSSTTKKKTGKDSSSKKSIKKDYIKDYGQVKPKILNHDLLKRSESLEMLSIGSRQLHKETSKKKQVFRKVLSPYHCVGSTRNTKLY